MSRQPPSDIARASQAEHLMAHVALHTESRTGFEEAGPALNTHLTKPAQVLGCFLMQDDEAVLLEGNKKASAAFRTAMENALSGPSAAHPIEGYGSGSLSLAKVCNNFAWSLDSSCWIV